MKFFIRPPQRWRSESVPKWHLFTDMDDRDRVVARCGFKYLGTVSWRDDPPARSETCRKCAMLAIGSYNDSFTSPSTKHAKETS